MEALKFTYNSSENAWSSGKITLTGNVLYKICFGRNKYGRVVIQKQNGANLPSPKVYISPTVNELHITLRGSCTGKIIEIFTSIAPSEAGYIKV